MSRVSADPSRLTRAQVQAALEAAGRNSSRAALYRYFVDAPDLGAIDHGAYKTYTAALVHAWIQTLPLRPSRLGNLGHWAQPGRPVENLRGPRPRRRTQRERKLARQADSA